MNEIAKNIEQHIPVLINELIEHLNITRNSIVCDMTLGLGGHAEEILKKKMELQFLGIDADATAISLSQKRLQPYQESNLIYIMHSNFSDFAAIKRRLNIPAFNAIYMDLGVSSMQIDTPEKGFSFRFNGPLDMRLDQTQGVTAAHVVNSYGQKELAQIFFKYGEESKGNRIAAAIVRKREDEPFLTTLSLAEFIFKTKGRTSAMHPATKCFQALRIYVNKELENLESVLPAAIDSLETGGRLAVISFHSLEDRIVKEAFNNAASPCDCPPISPICTCNKKPLIKILTKKPIVATDEEIEKNQRARSAKLRVVEKV